MVFTSSFKRLWLMAGLWYVSNGAIALPSSDRPNFVIIITDDQSHRAVGYNNPEVLTPHIDALAHEGLIFSNAFVSSPVCVASRASILTGLYPQANGTVALDKKSFIDKVVYNKTYRTIAQLLSADGYKTFFSGKSHLGRPKDYGFQFGDETYDHDDKAAFAQAHAFVKDLPDESPFFLWLAPRQPHLPLYPAKKILDLYNRGNIKLDKNFRKKPRAGSIYNQGLPGESFYRDTDYLHNIDSLPSGPPRSKKVMKRFIHAYYATVSNLDDQIGEFIRTLEQNGKLDNTVFIFLSDNGYFLGNHGLGNKLTMHEESVRVPMFIYWKKSAMRIGRTDALISTVDLFPTLLDLAGIQIPAYLQGQSFREVLFKDVPTRKYVISESVGVGGVIGSGHRMVRTARWKYMLSDANEEALYDLEKDPFEEKNLIRRKEFKSEIQSLRSFYHQWRNQVGDQKQLPYYHMP